MIDLRIPGREPIHVENLVIDFNGTMAVDGMPKSGCLERLARLAQNAAVHVVTADTFGSVTELL